MLPSNPSQVQAAVPLLLFQSEASHRQRLPVEPSGAKLSGGFVIEPDGDYGHFHPWAEERCEFRWKDGAVGLLVLTSHIKIMEIRINWPLLLQTTSSAHRCTSHRKVCWVNVKKIHKIAKVIFIVDFLTSKREGLSEWNARQRKESLA